jgi:hypothetical protein
LAELQNKKYGLEVKLIRKIKDQKVFKTILFGLLF